VQGDPLDDSNNQALQYSYELTSHSLAAELRTSNMVTLAAPQAQGTRDLRLVTDTVQYNTDSQGCHTRHPEAFWQVYWAGGRAALSITPYMNWAGYCRQRNYCSKFILLQ
jgi:hypothetical protein